MGTPPPRPLAMLLVSLQLCSTHLGAKVATRHTQEQSNQNHGVHGDVEDGSQQLGGRNTRALLTIASSLGSMSELG